MRTFWLILLVTIVPISFWPSCLAAQQAASDEAPTADESDEEFVPDETAIRANAEKYVEAYNRRDSATMAAMWSPDAVYMDPGTGEGYAGREAINAHFDDVLAGSEDAKLAVTITSIDFVSPNVALEKGTAVLTYSEYEPEQTEYTAVHVKRDGEWLLDRVSEAELPEPAPSNYEQLQELEWMIGSWVDNDEDAGISIQTDCAWTRNRNFMTRSFAAVIGDQVDVAGMQIVGWDPVAKQMRSWVFDSEGGFAEGRWTQKEGRWIVQSTGTLPDGSKSSAINIITQVDADSFRWQSVNRHVDGKLQPNLEEVLIVRKTDDESQR